ncbi:hypothetical protein J6590_051227 [Homalodisca vitripennis]|nr:hypothetical protein J6590_051227 [Homalodisca vitripennis]
MSVCYSLNCSRSLFMSCTHIFLPLSSSSNSNASSSSDDVMGGLRAVMWTDTIQNVFTLFGTIFVVVVGFWRLGGPREVLRINEQGTRLEIFNLNPDPTARNTFWTIMIGYTCSYLTGIVANPGSVQKFLSVPTYRHTKW